MIRTIAKRLLALVPMLFVVSFVVYSLVLLVPGDPAVTLAGDNPTAEQIAETRVRLGLDDSILVQYGRWVSNAVQGDLGESLYSTQPVSTSVMSRLPTTLSLTFAAIGFALLVAVPAGLLAARRPRGIVDRLTSVGSSIGVALPSFWVGLVLIVIFTIKFDLLPPVGYVGLSDNPLEWLSHIALPAVALGSVAAAETTRQLRGAMVDVLKTDYVRTATAAGIRQRSVILRYALKNAASPVLTVVGLQVTFLLGGSAIVERMFNIPGLGSLAIDAVLSRDLPVIQGVIIVAVIVSVLANLLVDVAYGMLNPKVRV
ncbi:MAG: ABC transporter permease [Ilumatobacteraceae bacterium]